MVFSAWYQFEHFTVATCTFFQQSTSTPTIDEQTGVLELKSVKHSNSWFTIARGPNWESGYEGWIMECFALEPGARSFHCLEPWPFLAAELGALKVFVPTVAGSFPLPVCKGTLTFSLSSSPVGPQRQTDFLAELDVGEQRRSYIHGKRAAKAQAMRQLMWQLTGCRKQAIMEGFPQNIPKSSFGTFRSFIDI